ncbi:MAG: ATP-binding cassette domain-containing protein [Gammaproteobacteria bacterium]|nr:ATP-binding cassette domain-containing protein [Gammaproteobacteria bacterium]
MITLTHLSLQRGSKLLLENTDLTIHPGWKTGVTGANGCGKSSLFALLNGELGPDQGNCRLPSQWVIAAVAQETPAVNAPALDYVLDGDAELRETERHLADARQAGDGLQEAEWLLRYENIDGYSARARAAQLMHGLGFAAGEEDKPVSVFSGGWRMRLNLAQALMCRSDLLLLDEPTNHLDLDAVIWLEQWLTRYPGTLLLISHDRDFLDNAADHIVCIEQRQLTLYTGNYTAFERRRAEKLALQQASYEKQQQTVARLDAFINRFRAKATKAKQAQSRINALERMEIIAPAHVDSPFRFQFGAPHSCPDPLLTLEEVSVGYDGEPVLEKLNLRLVPGSRTGLLGPNGAGKSTLIKLLAGALPPLAGERQASPGLKIGYFAQHLLEQLRPQDSPLLHLQRLAPEAGEQTLRDFIGGFGFSGDQALSPCEPFSGGEKARLVLALLVWQKPNLLLLDEPTNHLDIEMRHALVLALQDYQGALVAISHDRHLLRTTSDRLLLVAKGRAVEFDGDLEAYRQWLLEHRTEQKNLTPAKTGAHKQQQKQQAAAQRARRRLLENRIKKLDREIASFSREKQELETQLADPALYQNRDKARDCARLQAETSAKLTETEEKWLTLQEELELCL